MPEAGGSRRPSTPPRWRAARRTHCGKAPRATAARPPCQCAGAERAWQCLAMCAHLNTITMSRWARLDTGQSSARLLLFEMSRHPSIADVPISQQAPEDAALLSPDGCHPCPSKTPDYVYTSTSPPAHVMLFVRIRMQCVHTGGLLQHQRDRRSRSVQHTRHSGVV
jgi:hypothetical protein